MIRHSRRILERIDCSGVVLSNVRIYRTLTQPKSKSPSPSTPRKRAAKVREAVELTGKQRQYLKGLAHGKKAVLQIGKSGATKALLDELNRALEAHELVKVRILRECPVQLDELIGLVEQATQASTVGAVGKVATWYRPRLEDPVIVLPSPSGRKKRAASNPTTAKPRKTPVSE